MSLTYAELVERQKWPLDKKIEYSLSKIWEFGELSQTSPMVSYSGGKDSSVLLWLVRQELPNTKACFIDTRLEYPEIRSFVRNTPNTLTLRPKHRFKNIVSNWGWPMVSKKVSRFVHDLQNPTTKNAATRHLRLTGETLDGTKTLPHYKIPKKWKFMVKQNRFRFSDRCCVFLKESPFSGLKSAQFIGTRADDSQRRKFGYLKNGCNLFGATVTRSTPLAFWTEQDILECIQTHKIPVCSVYGEIRKTLDGLQFSKAKNTGCVFCGYGLQNESHPNRFEKLRETHPNLWKYAVEKLGLKETLSFMRKNTGNDIFCC